MHVVRLWGTEVRAVLESSTGEAVDSLDQLLRTDSATVTYSWDSPGESCVTGTAPRTVGAAGLVPLGETPGPRFSVDMELGSNSVINYGSYANHHRYLWQ